MWISWRVYIFRHKKTLPKTESFHLFSSSFSLLLFVQFQSFWTCKNDEHIFICKILCLLTKLRLCWYNPTTSLYSVAIRYDIRKHYINIHGLLGAWPWVGLCKLSSRGFDILAPPTLHELRISNSYNDVCWQFY